jgi:hypothetical protein
VQAVWAAVSLHRLEPRADGAARGVLSREKLLQVILESVAVPR